MNDRIAGRYDAFFRQFTPERYRRYVTGLEETLGPNIYRFATTPLFLPEERFARLVDITNSVVRLLAAPRYQELVTRTPWFMAQYPLQLADYFGCVDYHVAGDAEKIIEVNFCPPGHVGLTEMFERRFHEAFDLGPARRMNEGFDEALVRLVTENGTHRKVVIAVNHTVRSKNYFPHYRYVARIFAEHGVDARILYAKDVELDAGSRPAWNGERFDRIFNLVIPRNMQYEPEPFERYLEAFRIHPAIFFPNPLGWKLATKAFQAVCSNLSIENFGIAKEDQERIEDATLETHHLSRFHSSGEVADHFGGASNIVLKPLDDYHARGVFIGPSTEQLERVFADERERYVAQRYFPSDSMPRISPEGEMGMYHHSVRVGFVDGKAFSVRSYSYTDPLGWDEITPVVIAWS
jgi:hypothetical protein